MIKAWRRPDGRYTMISGTLSGWLDGREFMRRAGIDPEKMTNWVLDAKDIDWTTTEKVFGVLAGPSSCGCEPAGFRWVTESEVKAGRTVEKQCRACTPSPRADVSPSGTCITFAVPAPVCYECEIIEIMGEADVARQVYEAEFAGKYEGVTG
jgi:hypothetical protein